MGALQPKEGPRKLLFVAIENHMTIAHNIYLLSRTQTR